MDAGIGKLKRRVTGAWRVLKARLAQGVKLGITPTLLPKTLKPFLRAF